MDTVRLRPQQGTRFSGAVAPKIDKTFLNTAAQGFKDQQTRQEIQDKRDYSFFKADLENKNENALIQAKVGVTSQSGLNSIKALKDNRDNLDKQLAKNLESVPERFRPLIEGEGISGKFRNRYEGTALPYTVMQSQKVKQEAFNQHSLNTINSTIESSGSDMGLRVSLDEISKSVIQSARNKYGDNVELIAGAVNKSQSDALLRSVGIQAKSGNLNRAAEILYGVNADVFTPDDKVKAIGLLDSAKKDEGDRYALGLSEEAMKTSDNLIAQEAVVRSHVTNNGMDAAVYTRTMSILNSRNSIANKQKKAEGEKIMGAVNTHLIKGGQLTNDLLLSVPEAQRAEVIRNAEVISKGLPVSTDFRVFDDLSNQMANDRKAFSERDLSSFRTKLSRKDFSTFSSAQTRIGLELQSKTASLTESAYSDVVRNFAALNGDLIPADPEYSRISSIAFEEAERLKQENPKIGRAELSRKIKAALITKYVPTVVKTPGFFNRITFGLIPTFNEEEIQPETIGPKIHPSWRDAVIERQKKNGASIDDSVITGILNRMQFNGINLSNPAK